MLTEILETRVMVKSGMKQDKKDKVLQRLLNNRQLALKLIANVTYGYTSASFSGRMPCAEIADSIVQSGRETLEKAIAMIHSVEKWGAEVVYGDTDSLFVHLKGRTKDEAFKIGKEIAETITKANPRPVKLKFEKVYFPCVLLAKKRYVGFKYEHPDQVVPEFDAKGIETVRRDGTPAEQRIEEKALRILFRTQDLSKVREYFQKECLKIMTGQISIQDFLFAKEVKLGHYSDKGPGPPGALIATKKMQEDRRLEPQYGERVPYIVIAGAPGARLIDRCVDPDVLLKDDQAELDAEYYISKNLVPPLERIFTLVGANVRGWYDEMPKTQRLRTLNNVDSSLLQDMSHDDQGVATKRTLETYMREKACLVCSAMFVDNRSSDEEMSTGEDEIDEPTLFSDASGSDSDLENDLRLRKPQLRMRALRGLVCDECASSANDSMYTLQRQLTSLEQRVKKIHTVCRDCSGLSYGEAVQCDSKDCPVFYARVKETNMMRSVTTKVRLLTSKMSYGNGKDALAF
jgi:DNA polymerase zeta